MNKIIISIVFAALFATTAFAAWSPSDMDKYITQTNFLLDIAQPKDTVKLVKKNDDDSKITAKPAEYLCSATLINKSEGLMLTAAHCFQDATATDMTVSQPGYDDDDNEHQFKVIAIDTDKDLAVFKVIDGSLANTDQATLACKAPEIRGTKVYAVGNPLGLFGVVSEGIIGLADIRADKEGVLETLISAPLSPGSSGGAIYNEDGHLIGVADMIIPDRSNLNFMIPVDVVTKFLHAHHIDFTSDCK